MASRPELSCSASFQYDTVDILASSYKLSRGNFLSLSRIGFTLAAKQLDSMFWIILCYMRACLFIFPAKLNLL